MRRRSARLATAGVALLGALLVWLVAIRVFPYHSLNHDEGVYLQQAAMLLEGQLNLWPPVEDALRPWFFVEDGDRLYPKYAPVPAAMFALGKLLGGYRLALPGIAAGVLALVVGVTAEAFDRRTGLLAAVFVLASPLFVLDTSVFLPYAPTTLLNLAFAYAYLRADRTGSRRWAGLAGGAIGLAFFARPYTAVLFAAPFVAHALWTLREWRDALPRQSVTAALGLTGVALALAYNAVMTGSPVEFPYQAFAPLDGLGFGRRRILGHEVVYTPDLALRANAKVVGAFYSQWIAGGVLGTGLALGGFAVSIRRGLDARTAALAGVAVTVIVGNVYFWGNFNLLGDLERAGDGLISALGPYYHFDLLVPTAAFAARGALVSVERARDTAREYADPRTARVVVVALVLLSASAMGATTVAAIDEPLSKNLETTETYERVYEPLRPPPENSLVLLPTPYGDWLNHPFQYLRNDPGFDGDVVYGLHDRPFELADAFPSRRMYRLVYRGSWAPFAGSPEASRLQRIRSVSGSRVRLAATVGIPEGAIGVTVRVEAGGESAYYVARNASGSLALRLNVTQDRIRVEGDVRRVGNGTLALDGDDEVRLSAFVDYGPGGGFTYLFDLPVEASGERIRALTPRIERCRDVRTCGGAAAYIPGAAPDEVFVDTILSATERNP